MKTPFSATTRRYIEHTEEPDKLELPSGIEVTGINCDIEGVNKSVLETDWGYDDGWYKVKYRGNIGMVHKADLVYR
jgi:hypothetical protein